LLFTRSHQPLTRGVCALGSEVARDAWTG